MNLENSTREPLRFVSRAPRALFFEIQTALRAIYSLPEARALSCRLVEHVFRVPFHHFLLDADMEMSGEGLRRASEALARLLDYEPIQYVVGEAFFCDLPLRVTPAVLIPRPETELLTLALLRLYRGRAPRIADLGTGSGAIAVALAKGLPHARVEAFDVSSAALAIARENGERNAVAISFAEMDILSPRAQWPAEAWHLVVSNPPYIPASREVRLDLNVARYEPRLALYVPDDDPLIFYRAILQRGKLSLKAGGMMAFEIERDYAARLRELALRSGYGAVEVLDDFSGNPRFLVAAQEEGNAFVSEFVSIMKSY